MFHRKFPNFAFMEHFIKCFKMGILNILLIVSYTHSFVIMFILLFFSDVSDFSFVNPFFTFISHLRAMQSKKMTQYPEVTTNSQ